MKQRSLWYSKRILLLIFGVLLLSVFMGGFLVFSLQLVCVALAIGLFIFFLIKPKASVFLLVTSLPLVIRFKVGGIAIIPSWILIMMGVSIIVVRIALRQQELHWTLVHSLVVIFMLSGCLSLLANMDNALAMPTLIRETGYRLLMTLCFFVAAEIPRTLKEYRSIMLWTVIIGAVVAIGGVFSFGASALQQGGVHYETRASLSFLEGGQNALASFVGLCIVLAVSYILAHGTKWSLRWMLIVSVLGIALILTASRAAFLFVGTVLFVIIFRKRKSLFFTLLIMLLILYFVLPQNLLIISNRLATIFTARETLDRIKIYSLGMHLILLKPVLGNGIGAIYVTSGYLGNILWSFWQNTGLDVVTSHLHSFPLQLAFDQGMVGVFVFFGLLTAILKMAIRTRHNYGNTERGKLAFALGLSLLPLLLQNLVDFTFDSSAIYPLMFIIFGLLVGVCTTSQESLEIGSIGKPLCE
jgi:O-antigen ligase